jgi:hypothetical protein
MQGAHCKGSRDLLQLLVALTSCNSRCAQVALQEAVTIAAAVVAAAGGTSAGKSAPHAAAAAWQAW